MGLRLILYLCGMGNERGVQLRELISNWLINNVELSPGTAQLVEFIILLLAVALLCGLVYVVSWTFVNRILTRAVKKTSSEVDDILLEKGVFNRLIHIIPAVVFNNLAPVVFYDYPGWIPTVNKFIGAYITFLVVRAIIAFLSALNLILSRKEDYRDKPIASYLQLGKILATLFGAILIASMLLGRNPIYMFTALGAASAVLLLIFKDTLLGFMGSIQLSMNNMVRIGDWVTVPKYGADGDVIEINLTTIKVRNWDQTITMVPTYSFISDSFQNWRGMQESGGRRIKRSVHIRQDSVRFVDPKLLEILRKIQLLQPYLERRLAEIEEHNKKNLIDTSNLVNGRNMTNLGCFRQYLLAYISANPKVNHEMTTMVRQLAPTVHGLPMEIYCFSADKTWVNYEYLQADIFDHVLAVIKTFDLQIHEAPTGSDISAAIIALQAAGKLS